MIVFAYYLLKVIICSGVLFLYYHMALRNKLFHQWNRFYLLAAIFISLIAPIIQISIVHHSQEEANKAIQLLRVIQGGDYLDEIVTTGRQTISAEQWLALLYVLISVSLFIGLILSLLKVFSIVKSHTIQWLQNIKFINTNLQGTPFSFLNFIFWNEDIDLQTETGQQIFQHELVHVKERHTLDKLFVQLILVVFWCNPFFWLIRRELKLIHEFIADQKAVGEHGAAALAAMILSSSYSTHFNSITNQFFQTSIKRRLAMLAKIQNPKINYLSRVLALPILAITVLAFTLKTKTVSTTTINLEKPITVVIDAGHGLMANGAYNGARDGDVYEDEITLAIGNKIKELNDNDKIKIVLTRPTEQIVDLKERVGIAKENNADLFVSIHVNASSDNQNPNLASAKSINKGFEIYVSGKQPVYQQQSELFGSVLQQELSSIYSMNSSLLKRNVGVWVLDHNVCPSVVVECGFLTDKDDKTFITKKENQTAVAEKILEAIQKYASNQQTTQKAIDDIVPQKNVQINEVTLKDTSPSTKEDAKKTNLKINSKKLPLFIVDGKETSKAEIDKINPSTIESINVFKAGPEVSKYGKKGVNGVVEIELKTNRKNDYITLHTDSIIATAAAIVMEPFLNTSATRSQAETDTIPKTKSQSGKLKEVIVKGYSINGSNLKSNAPKTDTLSLKEIEVQGYPAKSRN